MSKQRLRIIAVGDISFNGGYHRLLERIGPGFPTRRLSPLWAAADLRVGNLESPVVASAPKVEPSKLTLRAAPRALENLACAGIDCVALANNHTMDYGEEGMSETIERLEGVGIAHHGAGRDVNSAQAPAIVERNGQRIGLLAYCDPSCGVTAFAHAGSPGVAALDIDDCCIAIRALRSNVDWVIVQIHWGQEMCRLPSTEQRVQARRMVAAGADLILGHHPHILQPCEWIAGVPVFYSLGNFLFSEMYWRGCNSLGEHYCCRLRLHPDCRQVGWAEIILRQGNPIEARLHPARLKRSLEVVPDESPGRLSDWNRLCRRLEVIDYEAEYAPESRRAAALRDWSYESRSLFRRLETRLFHYGLIPLGSEGT
jgi:poly-gamma-glutamate capsule biosynthesis protein CapA/YwtB (metallophosphatase superfamily)